MKSNMTQVPYRGMIISHARFHIAFKINLSEYPFFYQYRNKSIMKIKNTSLKATSVIRHRSPSQYNKENMGTAIIADNQIKL